ncbi:hypothetical protein ACFFRR_000296 [Megaselia abdita]
MEENHFFAEARNSGLLEANFQEQWKLDKEYGEWIEESEKQGFFYCKFCQKSFPLGPSGNSQIAKHNVSIKHKQKREIFHQGHDDDDSDEEIDVSDPDGRRSKRIAYRKMDTEDLKDYIAYEDDEENEEDEEEDQYEDLEMEGKSIIEQRKKVLQEAEESQDDDFSGESEEEPIPVYVMEGNPRFLQEWKTDPDLSPWLVEKANNTAYCSYCKCFLRISAGKKALTKHMKTDKHKKNRPYIIQEFQLGDNVSEVVIPKVDETDKGFVKKRRYAKYSPRWGLDPDLKDWITEKRGLAFCKICSQYLRVISGRKNLIRHKNSQKHITNEESLVKQQCRICLKNHDLKFMPSIWDRDKFTDMKIYRKIMHCTGIVIKREDTEKVTDKICLGCADQLNTSFNFLKTCEFSEKFFDSISRGVPVDMPKEDYHKMETGDGYSDEESYGEDDYVDDGSDPTYSHIKKEKNVILEESMQSVVYEETAGIHMEEGTYEAEIITDGLGDFKDAQNIQILSSEIIGEEMKFEIKEPLIKRFRPNDVKHRVKSYAEEAKVVRNVAPEQQIYICDVCGNTYDKKSKLQTHIKNHSDEKPHECEICGKTFKHASKLSMHMFTHTGEKPFKCNYCERKFGDHTSRKRHERLHRNERPFVCQVCSKTFTYASALKAHKVVHTGEKNFQ